MNRAVCVICVALVAGATACAGPPADPPSVTARAAVRAAMEDLSRSRLAGRDLYLRYCEVCHGASGDGDGFNASALPNDLPRLAERAAALGERAVRAHIDRGAETSYPPSPCPPYGGNLTDAERTALAAHVMVGAETAGPGVP